MMRQTTRLLLIIIIVACLFFKRKRETFEQNVPYKQFYEMITYNMKHKMDDPKWVKYVDKLEFKKYAASVGVKTFPNLAVYSQKDSNMFSFDNLPRDYIIKSNKGSGRNIIVRDGKVDREKVLSEIKNWGKIFHKSEPQYEYIKPKIFVEPLIYPIPQDIKVFYYNGKPVTIEIDVGRFTNHTRNYYDTEGNLMKMKHNNYDNTKKGSKTILDDIKKHDKLGELIKITDKLAKGVSLNLFRVDIYYVGGEFYGGEITLTAGAGKGQLEYLEN